MIEIEDVYSEISEQENMEQKTRWTRLANTGLFWKLEHLKIKTRLIDEMFASVMAEYVFLK
jgi:hypothetical protein